MVMIKTTRAIYNSYDSWIFYKNKKSNDKWALVEVANFKLEILMSNIFNAKTITQPIHA